MNTYNYYTPSRSLFVKEFEFESCEGVWWDSMLLLGWEVVPRGEKRINAESNHLFEDTRDDSIQDRRVVFKARVAIDLKQPYLKIFI
jgi:hypothetical protein